MTQDEAVDFIANDASVREAHRRVVNDVPVEASLGELQAAASMALRVAIGELLVMPSVADQIFENSYSLTLTSATEYDIGQYGILKVREILLGSDSRPLRPFFEDSGDFYEWRERRYAGNDLSGSTIPYAAYITRKLGKLYLNLWPGPGGESTLTLIHNRVPPEPFKIEMFPNHMHGAILVGGVRWANGGFQGYSDQWEQAKSDIVRGLDPARGTTSKVRKSDTLRRFLRRQNSSAAGLSSSYPSLVKTR